MRVTHEELLAAAQTVADAGYKLKVARDEYTRAVENSERLQLRFKAQRKEAERDNAKK